MSGDFPHHCPRPGDFDPRFGMTVPGGGYTTVTTNNTLSNHAAQQAQLMAQQNMLNAQQAQMYQNIPAGGIIGLGSQYAGLQQAVQPLPYSTPGGPMFATQMQGASLIPTNPVVGDVVQMYFDGVNWQKVPPSMYDSAAVKKLVPMTEPAFSLDEINQAQDEIEDARCAA